MSSLETSVTLDDVFTVVEAKRVPLAPELAGYLTLEIADGTDAGSGDVDPKTVFISEEGTVALVRPKKDSVTGDAEASVRKLLTKLLDASGSGTPALSTAAKRKPGNGLPALVEELEAALIPVNRAAGRRALARLAREVKRVLLGVGRNASVPPVQQRDAPAKAAPHARPALRKKEEEPKPQEAKISEKEKPAAADVSANLAPPPEVAVRRAVSSGSFEPEEHVTAKRQSELSELASNMNAVDSTATNDPKNAETKNESRLERKSPPPPEPTPERKGPPPLPLPAPPGSGAPGPLPPPKRDVSPIAPPVKAPPAAPVFGRDDVDDLLDSFGVSSAHEDKAMARELKAMAGLSPTPPPPDARTLADLTKDVGKGLPLLEPKSEASLQAAAPAPPADDGGIEALLALADASGPLPAISSERAKIVPEAAPPPAPFTAPPVPPPLAPPNLPPSPIFGASSSSAANAGSAPGAPAALRNSDNAVRPEAKQTDPFHNKRAVPPGPALAAPSTARKPADATGPHAPHTGSASSATETRKNKAQPRQRAPRTGMAMLIFALLVLAGGTGAVWKFAPQIFTGKKKPPTTATAPTTPVPPPAKCKVALVLTEVPTNAEILLRMGQAPVDVERMPVGTRLELVGTAEGHAPRRAVIKSDAQWEKGPDGKPRIEVPVQLDPSKAKPGAVDPWPAAEPGSQVGGSGAPGTVHVISNVRGAEIWLLAGLGPEARIDQLRCDADIDVLIAGPPSLRKRLHVGDKEISAVAPDAAGNKVVNVSAK